MLAEVAEGYEFFRQLGGCDLESKWTDMKSVLISEYKMSIHPTATIYTPCIYLLTLSKF